MQFAATKQDESGNNKRAVILNVDETPRGGQGPFRFWSEARLICEELDLILEGAIYLTSATNAGTKQ